MDGYKLNWAWTDGTPWTGHFFAKQWVREKRWGVNKEYARSAAVAVAVTDAQCSNLLTMEGMIGQAEDTAVSDVAKRLPDYRTTWPKALVFELQAGFRAWLVENGLSPESWQYVAMERAYVRMLQTCKDQRRESRAMRRLMIRVPTARLCDGVQYRSPIVRDGGAWRFVSLGTGDKGWVRPSGLAPDPSGAAYAEIARMEKSWWVRLVWSDGTRPKVELPVNPLLPNGGERAVLLNFPGREPSTTGGPYGPPPFQGGNG